MKMRVQPALIDVLFRLEAFSCSSPSCIDYWCLAMDTPGSSLRTHLACLSISVVWNRKLLMWWRHRRRKWFVDEIETSSLMCLLHSDGTSDDSIIT